MKTFALLLTFLILTKIGHGQINYFTASDYRLCCDSIPCFTQYYTSFDESFLYTVNTGHLTIRPLSFDRLDSLATDLMRFLIKYKIDLDEVVAIKYMPIKHTNSRRIDALIASLESFKKVVSITWLEPIQPKQLTKLIQSHNCLENLTLTNDYIEKGNPKKYHNKILTVVLKSDMKRLYLSGWQLLPSDFEILNKMRLMELTALYSTYPKVYYNISNLKLNMPSLKYLFLQNYKIENIDSSFYKNSNLQEIRILNSKLKYVDVDKIEDSFDDLKILMLAGHDLPKNTIIYLVNTLQPKGVKIYDDLYFSDDIRYNTESEELR